MSVGSPIPDLPRRGGHPMSTLVVRGVLAGLVFILVAFVSWGLLQPLFVWGLVSRLFGHAEAGLFNVTGWNPHLLRGLLILVFSPLAWAIFELSRLGTLWTSSASWNPWASSEAKERERSRRARAALRGKVARAIVVCYPAAYLILLGLAPSKFDQQGRALKGVWNRPDGRIVCDLIRDAAGRVNGTLDPATGLVCEEVAAGSPLALVLELVANGKVPQRVLPDDPVHYPYFRADGTPNVWYGRSQDGAIELFSQLGFHPRTGYLLAPVTPDVVEAYLTQVRAEAAATARAKSAVEERARMAENAERLARERSARAEFQGKYVDLSMRGESPEGVVGVAVIGLEDAQALPISAAVIRGLRVRGMTPRSPFRTAFARSRLADELFDGSPGIWPQLGLSELCGAVVLARGRWLDSPTFAGGLAMAEVEVVLREIGAGGVIRGEARIRRKGGGPDPKAAVASTLELAARDLELEAANWP